MNIESSCLTLALVSLLALTAVGARAVAQDPAVAAKASSPAKENIEVSVQGPKEPVTLGDFSLSITVTNRGSAAIEFMDISSIPRCCGILVCTEDGRVCERTFLGNALFREDRSGASWDTGLVIIGPGKSHTWKPRLEDLYLLKPGKYKMAVKFEKKVEEINFTIRS